MQGGRVLGLLLLGLVACGDEPVTPTNTCPESDQPPTGAHRLYLDFDGQDVVAGPDDATMNRSSLVPQAVTVPAFLAGEVDAEAQIATIVASVQTALAPYDVEVTRERPASGTYDMIVFGGQSDAVVGQAGLQFAGPTTCMGGPAAQVGFVFEIRKPLLATAATAVGVYAVMHGATTTSTRGDCLCLDDPACAPEDTQCTFAADALASGSAACGGESDEVDGVQEMIDAFGCRP
jgi:hypothetical protein